MSGKPQNNRCTGVLEYPSSEGMRRLLGISAHVSIVPTPLNAHTSQATEIFGARALPFSQYCLQPRPSRPAKSWA